MRKIITKYKFKLRLLFCICLIIIIFTTACSQQNQQNKQNSNKSQTKAGIQNTKVYSNIMEINSILIDLMSQVDLIPYYESQIKEKKKKEKEQKQQNSKAKTTKENQGGQNQSASSESGSDNNSSGKNDIEKFKPKPITINDTLLTKTLEQEKTYQTEQTKERKIPTEIVEIWHEVNTKINDLHQKWDSLQPKLSKANISEDKISNFEKSLNELTVASTKNKQKKTLLLANQLTSYIPTYIEKAKNKTFASIHLIKYYARQILLEASDNKKGFQNIIENIKESEQTLSKELEKNKKKELSTNIKSSIENLKKAISINDINVLKLKAAILVKNINSAKKEISLK